MAKEGLKKKVSHSEMKTDSLVLLFFKAREYYQENKKQVNYILAAFAVIVVGFLWMNSRAAENNKKATAELGTILPYFERGQYDIAINGIPQQGVRGLRTIVREYGSTKAGESATFFLANALYAISNYAEALEFFLETDLNDSELSASALAGAAASYEALGRFSESAEYYERAARTSIDENRKAEYTLLGALAKGSAGKKEDAVDLLVKLKKSYPATIAASQADKYIAQFSS